MTQPIIYQQPLQAPVRPAAKPDQGGQPVTNSAFAKVFEDKLASQPVKFSQHAQERLKARGISVSDVDMKKLVGAVDSVAQKGGKDSLVMLGDSAFVVSVKNRTVVTAMDREAMRGNVFTNIDSAVVL
jgi:flagellar operon protein